MITAKIDVTKIDKDRLFKGKSGTYLDVALIPTPNDKYGNDYMIVQSVSKEEREAGERGPIIGNARELKSQKASPPSARRETSTAAPAEEDNSVPF